MSLVNRTPVFTTSVICHINTKANLKRINYTGVIDNFKRIHMARGVELSSERFSGDDDFQWQVFLHPNPGNDWISLELYLDNPPQFKASPVTGNFHVSILDVRNRPEITRRENFTISEHNKSSGAMIGYFVKKNHLLMLSNLLLPQDRLTIVCEISYMRDTDLPDISTGVENLKAFFEDKEFADVTIWVNGKHYPAHKIILAARSPVFKAMLRTDMIESRTNRIEINDMDETVFIEMLRYMYTGIPENLKTTVIGLLAAADKYDLKELKAICVKELINNLSMENVEDTLLLAVKYNIENLRTEAMEYSRILNSNRSTEKNQKDLDISNQQVQPAQQKYSCSQFRCELIISFCVSLFFLYFILNFA